MKNYINIPVRLKNPMFWVGLIGVILSPILAYFGKSASDLTTWETLVEMITSTFSNPFLLGSVAMAVLSFLGVVTDPTTVGLKDSQRALTYDAPNDGSDYVG